MTVRSHRLVGPVIMPTSTASPVAEVPAGFVWIVKDIRVVSLLTESLFYDLRLDPDDVAKSLNYHTVLTALGINVDTTWQVLEPGDLLYAKSSRPDGAVLWASGAALTL